MTYTKSSKMTLLEFESMDKKENDQEMSKKVETECELEGSELEGSELEGSEPQPLDHPLDQPLDHPLDQPIVKAIGSVMDEMLAQLKFKWGKDCDDIREKYHKLDIEYSNESESTIQTLRVACNDQVDIAHTQCYDRLLKNGILKNQELENYNRVMKGKFGRLLEGTPESLEGTPESLEGVVEQSFIQSIFYSSK
jgi:hypothetical protein